MAEWGQWGVTFAVQTLVSALLAYPIARVTSKAQARTAQLAEFRARVERLLDRAIQYPYVEEQEFAVAWPARDPKDERYWRYDNYCCLVFNLIEDLWKFTSGKSAEMEKILAFEECIHLHREWWKDNRGHNVVGYPADGFYEFVEQAVARTGQSKGAA